MAADQAVEIADVPVKVVRTRTVQQGLTALVLGYNPEGTLEDNAEAMTAALGDVKSGAVTVSYTHLRAHETDSYLVCRLLLEKKKTTHT